MALWKRGKRYWTRFTLNGEQLRRPLCPPGSTRATTNKLVAISLDKETIRAAMQGELAPRDPSIKLFAAVDDYLEAKKATANSPRAVEFDRERLEVVKRVLGDVRLTTITRKTIEGFQAKRRLERASNRTINMDVGALRQVLKRFKQWRRLEDDVKMLTEAGGKPVGRALTPEERKRLFEAAASNPEWEHVYCAAVLAANSSMRGVEVKHIRRRDVDLEKIWDAADGATAGRGVIYVGHSKNETSKRLIPLNSEARGAVERMLRRADQLGHTDSGHYLWCASQHHTYDPMKPAKKWDGA
jgi:integrase